MLSVLAWKIFFVLALFPVEEEEEESDTYRGDEPNDDDGAGDSTAAQGPCKTQHVEGAKPASEGEDEGGQHEARAMHACLPAVLLVVVSEASECWTVWYGPDRSLGHVDPIGATLVAHLAPAKTTTNERQEGGGRARGDAR